jgi:hypothetical protein
MRGNFLSSSGRFSFSGRTLLHGWIYGLPSARVR